MIMLRNFMRQYPASHLPVLVMALAAMLFVGCDSANNDPPNVDENPSPSDEIDTQSIFTAMTDDGVELKLRRYRPANNAAFNQGRQPVLMLPGVGMNMNEFLPSTTEHMKDVYSQMKLPANLPGWAVGDEYIQKDHLLFYNLGHFLWLQGYDPWFANNRGTGREPYNSEAGINATNLDVYGCLDVPALVEKVKEVTGLKPVIGGHSTGGVASYIYLQGAYMNTAEVKQGQRAFGRKYLPHVKMSPRLAGERNKSVRGFVALDPAGIPPLPESLDFNLAWRTTNMPVVMRLDNMMESMLIDSGSTGTMMSDLMGTMFGAISEAAGNDESLEWVHFFETNNMDPYILDHYIRYATTNFYMRLFNQYYDWGMNNVMREGYTNGRENRGLVVAPPREEGDGYYYYEDHMDRITAPTLCFLSQYDGLVAAATMIEDLMEAKTPHAKDKYHIVPDTAHADLPCGIQAPTIVFPMMGEWLKQLN